jgi:hypothetical protein
MISLTTVLFVILVIVLIGALPVYPHSSEWGWSPAAVIVTVLVVLLLLRVFHVL